MLTDELQANMKVDPSLNVFQLAAKYGPPSGLAPCQLAIIILFGINAFIALVLELHIWLATPSDDLSDESEGLLADGSDEGSTAAPAPPPKKVVGALVPTLGSVQSLTRCILGFSAIMIFAYVMEKFPLWGMHGKRHDDPDLYWFLCLLLLFVSLATLKKVPAKQAVILHRDQTEEWKGWMQYMFVAYHYFHAEGVYNLIRVLVSCYVWMTGFGNFSFFYTQADFGIVRLLQVRRRQWQWLEGSGGHNKRERSKIERKR